MPPDGRSSESGDLRERVADELHHNDICGIGPVTRKEYLDDADALIALIAEGVGANAWKALWDRAVLAEAERDRFREALRRWMPHDHAAQMGPGRPVNGCERCKWEAEGLL